MASEKGLENKVSYGTVLLYVHYSKYNTEFQEDFISVFNL